MPSLLYVLAGGKSRRFGSDKSLTEVAGRTLIEHTCCALERFGDVAILSGSDSERFADLPWRCVPDIIPGKGPMSGLHAAISDAENNKSKRVFLISVDMVGYQLDWIQALLDACPDRGAAAFKAEFWQPLFAVYDIGLLDQLEAHIAADKLAMWRFLEANSAVQVPLPESWSDFLSINTPEDLERLPESWKR